MSSQPGELTLTEGGNAQPEGEQARALDELFGRLYHKIRSLASRVRWSGTNPTLNPTALAHEAYMKLRRDPPELASKSYEEVIAIFANAMQQILMDAARRKGAQKRIAVELPERTAMPIEDAITIASALDELERDHPRQVQVVRCRFLLGMTTDETAAALRLARRTVEREWQEARERLGRRLHPPEE